MGSSLTPRDAPPAEMVEIDRETLNALFHNCPMNADGTLHPNERGMKMFMRISDITYGRIKIPRASGWRPIETAPKDGTLLLCFWRSSHCAVAYYDDGCWWDAGTDGLDDPTHWQPLPSPPAEQIQAPAKAGEATQSPPLHISDFLGG